MLLYTVVFHIIIATCLTLILSTDTYIKKSAAYPVVGWLVLAFMMLITSVFIYDHPNMPIEQVILQAGQILIGLVK